MTPNQIAKITELLNTLDMIAYGRSTDTAHYQRLQKAETAVITMLKRIKWKAITAPKVRSVGHAP